MEFKYAYQNENYNVFIQVYQKDEMEYDYMYKNCQYSFIEFQEDEDSLVYSDLANFFKTISN